MARTRLLCGVLVVTLATAAALRAQDRASAPGITAIPGVRVGHQTLTARPTGCTVILFPPDTVGSVHQPGGAPATIETDLLRPDNMVSVVHAIVLSGGSAFGLDAQAGVKRYLEEQKVGFAFGGAYVPIVPGASLFDLRVGNGQIRPDAQCGYEAARRAAPGPVEEGSVGAGAGATVGKIGNPARPMKGGIGTAALKTDTGLIVGAIVAVNAAGTVVDRRTGAPLAGARTGARGEVEDPWNLVRNGAFLPGPMLESGPMLANTTLVVVVTNARLTKAQAARIAIMADDGLARSIVPSHTTNDGDTVFALGTGSLAGEPDLTRIGAMAAEAVSDAIERAVRMAKGVPGYPAMSDPR